MILFISRFAAAFLEQGKGQCRMALTHAMKLDKSWCQVDKSASVFEWTAMPYALQVSISILRHKESSLLFYINSAFLQHEHLDDCKTIVQALGFMSCTFDEGFILRGVRRSALKYSKGTAN